MDIYNAWFDLKAGISDVEFSDRLKTYMGSLKNDGLMQGWRLMRRKLGLSAAPVGEFHLMMEFSGLAQLDSAFNRVGSPRADRERAFRGQFPRAERAICAVSGLSGFDPASGR
jgi:hypothetical protein